MKRRKIVIHHTYDLCKHITNMLHKNDIVFFDDCLFSQYVFIKKNAQFFINNNINAILGFSSALYAPEHSVSQIYDVKSYLLHDACNKYICTLEDADNIRNSFIEMNGFMKISQIKELLKLPFVKLALHGCCHLKLSNEKNQIRQAVLFKKDTCDGIKRILDIGINTSYYVYPYVEDVFMGNFILNKMNIEEIGGPRHLRMAIEDIEKGKFSYDS